MYLYVVMILPVRVRGVGAVGGTRLGDDQRTIAPLHIEGEVILQRVGQAGGIVSADLPGAVLLVAAVDVIALQRGHIHAVHARALSVEKAEAHAGGAEAEGRVQRIAGGVFQRAVAVNKKVLARGQRDLRKGERLEGVVGVEQRVALEGDVGGAGVDHFHPVAVAAILAGESRLIGGHDLADAHGGSGNALLDGGSDRGRQKALQQKTSRQRQSAHGGQNSRAPPGTLRSSGCL